MPHFQRLREKGRRQGADYAHARHRGCHSGSIEIHGAPEFLAAVSGRF